MHWCSIKVCPCRIGNAWGAERQSLLNLSSGDACLQVVVFVFVQQVGCCFGKNAGLWFGATVLHLCLVNLLPDRILTTTFIMINYCAQRFPAVVVTATTGSGSSWADCSKSCPSSWDIHQLRSPWGAGREFFWSLLFGELLENAAFEFQGRISIYCGKIEMFLSFKIALKNIFEFH